MLRLSMQRYLLVASDVRRIYAVHFMERAHRFDNQSLSMRTVLGTTMSMLKFTTITDTPSQIWS